MPRIIFVSTLTVWSMGKGHGGPAFYRTLTEYVNRGWDVYLITDEINNADLDILDDEHLIYVKPPIVKRWLLKRKIGLLFRYIYNFQITLRYQKEIEKVLAISQKETVLYAYEIAGVAACKNISAKYRIPFVTRFQGTILSRFQGTWLDKIRNYPHYQALATKADLVIMTDDGTKGIDVLKSLHNTSRTLFLRNGLELLEKNKHQTIQADDIDSFRKKFMGENAETCLFLTVSRLVAWKKVERAIDGFAEFCKFGIPGKLIIVGEGDARKELEDRAKSKGISDKVYFIGAIPHEDVYEYMLGCDIFLSLYDLSNVGNPLLEAMTLGKCIVTLDVGDTNKLIENRKNGILLTQEELPHLGKFLKELAESPELRKTLGGEAKNYAQKNFMNWGKRMEIELCEVSQLMK